VKRLWQILGGALALAAPVTADAQAINREIERHRREVADCHAAYRARVTPGCDEACRSAAESRRGACLSAANARHGRALRAQFRPRN
jgi:hypothetical protein